MSLNPEHTRFVQRFPYSSASAGEELKHSNMISISNLPELVTADDVRNVLKAYGQVDILAIPQNLPGSPTGRALVYIEDEEISKKVCQEVSDRLFRNSILGVEFARVVNAPRKEIIRVDGIAKSLRHIEIREMYSYLGDIAVVVPREPDGVRNLGFALLCFDSKENDACNDKDLVIREFALSYKFVKRPGAPERAAPVITGLVEAVTRDDLEKTHEETGPYWMIHRIPRPNPKPYSKMDSKPAWWLKLTGRKA